MERMREASGARADGRTHAWQMAKVRRELSQLWKMVERLEAAMAAQEIREAQRRGRSLDQEVQERLGGRWRKVPVNTLQGEKVGVRRKGPNGKVTITDKDGKRSRQLWSCKFNIGKRQAGYACAAVALGLAAAVAARVAAGRAAESLRLELHTMAAAAVEGSFARGPWPCQGSEIKNLLSGFRLAPISIRQGTLKQFREGGTVLFGKEQRNEAV